MVYRILFVGLAAIISMNACKSSQQAVDSRPPEKSDVSDLMSAIFDSSRVFSGNFTGFQLYDPVKDRVLYSQNETKYFTPASNTKLFTFYTGLKILPDSLPGLKYAKRGDSLIIWGTGDPSFLHPDHGNRAVYDFLKNRPEKLYYSDAHFRDELLGPGWAWSDYNYYYSAEKSPFPMYGNVVRFTIEEIDLVQVKSGPRGPAVSPGFFRSRMKDTTLTDRERESMLFRDFNQNRFEYRPQADTTTYTVDKPYHYTPGLITQMLSDTLEKSVEHIAVNMPVDARTIYTIEADSAYKHMLQPSDNFMAEQLLFVVASELGKALNSDEVIAYMKQNYLSEMPDEPQWVDGSGLSRYNLFTPRSMVWLLAKIYKEYPDREKLFELLPAGGRSGTIKNWYASRNGSEPYVFAKTGTLSNNHCLSGYLVTSGGRVLIFSFMNNHYVSSSSVIKEEMEKVLWFIHQNY